MTRALLIIDLQRAILDGLASPERQPLVDERLEDVAKRLGRAKLEAETAGLPVILVQHDGDAGHRLHTGSRGWELRDELMSNKPAIIVQKRSCDAFHETNLLTHLGAQNVDHLVVGGCMTQFCVDTTARRATSLGFDVTLLEDGHATADFGRLGFQEIIDHHNRLLDGFSAGTSSIKLASTDAYIAGLRLG